MRKGAGIFVFDGQAAHFSKEIAERDAEQAGFRLVRCELVHGKVWLYEFRVKGWDRGQGSDR